MRRRGRGNQGGYPRGHGTSDEDGGDVRQRRAAGNFLAAARGASPRWGGVNSKKWADYERVRDAQLRTFDECHEPRPLVERPDPKPEAEYAKVVKPDLEAAVAIGGLFAELARREAALKVAENDLRLAAEVFAGACGKFAKDEKMIADGLEYFAEYADEVLTENREHMKLEEAEMAERKRRLGL